MYKRIRLLASVVMGLCLASQASALTNSAVTLEWTKTTDATIRYELRWKHFANNWTWAPLATNLDSTLGTYAQTFAPFPDSTGDRGACWDARATRAGLSSAWLSDSGQQVCGQVPLGVVVVPPVVIPPPPSGLIISSATPDQIVIVASKADCPRVVTSTAGSTAITATRTLRCIK